MTCRLISAVALAVVGCMVQLQKRTSSSMSHGLCVRSNSVRASNFANLTPTLQREGIICQSGCCTELVEVLGHDSADAAFILVHKLEFTLT